MCILRPCPRWGHSERDERRTRIRTLLSASFDVRLDVKIGTRQRMIERNLLEAGCSLPLSAEVS